MPIRNSAPDRSPRETVSGKDASEGAADAKTFIMFTHRFTSVTTAGAVQRLATMLDKATGPIIAAVLDVSSSMRANRTESLRRFYNEGTDLLMIDGRGMYAAAALLGHRPQESTNGPALYEALLAWAEKTGKRTYLLGARKIDIERAAERLSNRRPRLAIAGHHHGYFEVHDDSVLETVTRARPDIIFIGISSPRRERLMDEWRSRLPPCLVVPVGGVLDIESGRARRAPHLMQIMGLEWMFRIVQEPFRIGPRVVVAYSHFAVALGTAFIRKLIGR